MVSDRGMEGPLYSTPVEQETQSRLSWCRSHEHKGSNTPWNDKCCPPAVGRHWQWGWRLLPHLGRGGGRKCPTASSGVRCVPLVVFGSSNLAWVKV